jgi:uncharacterized membrane protein
MRACLSEPKQLYCAINSPHLCDQFAALVRSINYTCAINSPQNKDFLMLRKAMKKMGAGRASSFEKRGHEVQRIETFSDAVFAFAVTLLIVSLEVPKSFEELMVSMRGFYAFGISFTLLSLIWFDQHVFFRRYGLADTMTFVLNITLNFVVLFYVYPLKFLFSLILNNPVNEAGSHKLAITAEQAPALMIIYGLGFMSIYFLFFLMYWHALRKKSTLHLTIGEEYDTRTKIYSNLIVICIGLCSVSLAYFLPNKLAGSAGLVYLAIFPILTFYYSFRGRRKRRIGI